MFGKNLHKFMLTSGSIMLDYLTVKATVCIRENEMKIVL